MLKYLNDLLKLLPFNGKKTIIGIVLSLVAVVFPDFPLNESHLTDFINAIYKISEYFGPIYLVIGLLHKWIKAKQK
jgi:hypothetical protein